ncbi:hypothetical protein [Sporosarcina sp. BI001-red]|uniref:hypothetical protein n=1 Tax=Sporosarcina sp. BI001-red TaxID=2282866 RepID=UPI0011C02328|nr:hypothetical protein [Sporosarcina sp. BI001-red]
MSRYRETSLGVGEIVRGDGENLMSDGQSPLPDEEIIRVDRQPKKDPFRQCETGHYLTFKNQ